MQVTPERDWELEAGLKQPEEKSLNKRLDNYARYVPTFGELGTGALLILLGFTARTGGGLAIKATTDSMPIWITLAGIPTWICWFVIWFGFDEMLLKGRATNWLARKYILPVIKVVLNSIVGEERIKNLEKRLEKKTNASNT